MSVDDAIRESVEAALADALAPLRARLERPAPLTFSKSQAADALGVSPTIVSRLIADGHLPRVPHTGTRVLVPRWAVESFAIHGRVVAEDAPAVEIPAQLRRVS